MLNAAFYSMKSAVFGLPPVQVLNEGKASEESSKLPAVELTAKLQKLMLRMEGEYIVEGGKGVNYAALRSSDLYKEYVDLSKDLQSVDLGNLSEDERKAFYLNIYNALTIHGLANQKSIPSSVLGVEHFWKTTAYNIGGLQYTLDEIEHGMLRNNRPHPSSHKPLLEPNDPRLAFAITNVDPRIHFALVCGAKSCPAIRVYSSANLDRALNVAAENFCQQEVVADVKNGKITLSKILDWYGSDFAPTPAGVVRWTIPFLSEDQRKEVEELLEKKGDNIHVSYASYNWNLNSK